MTAVVAPLRSLMAAKEKGETGRRARGIYCAPHLGRRWSEEAAPRWLAAAALELGVAALRS